MRRDAKCDSITHALRLAAAAGEDAAAVSVDHQRSAAELSAPATPSPDLGRDGIEAQVRTTTTELPLPPSDGVLPIQSGSESPAAVESEEEILALMEEEEEDEAVHEGAVVSAVSEDSEAVVVAVPAAQSSRGRKVVQPRAKFRVTTI